VEFRRTGGGRDVPVTQFTAMPKFHSDLVTRRLCATVHLDYGFARHVLEQLAEDGLEAVGLPFGVNVVALVRHARLAARRRERRDALLTGLVLAQCGGLVLAVWAAADGRPGAALVGLGALLAALPAGWAAVFHTARRARAAALALGRGDDPAADLAPPVEADLEHSLYQLKRANFMPYHASENRDRPFVGSGWLIQKSVWPPIDVGRPAQDAQGTPKTIIPFDASDLHHYLAVKMPGIVGLDRLKARNRLYGPGLHVSYLGKDVLPDPAHRPLAVVPTQLVKTAAVRPQARMETYLCLRHAAEGGFVIVTMHLRAHLLGSRLDWEVAAYVLPPLGERFHVVDRLPEGAFRLWWHTVRAAGRGFRRAFYGAPGRGWTRSGERAGRARQLARIRRDIDRGRIVYDYGAHSSLREDVADWDRMGYVETRDAEQFFQRLQQGVLLATEKFLEEHQVDTSDFQQTQKQIINTQTYNISGPVLGPSQWGANATMVNQQGAGGAGRQAAGGAAAGGGGT
jgi:hypothetical protein